MELLIKLTTSLTMAALSAHHSLHLLLSWEGASEARPRPAPPLDGMSTLSLAASVSTLRVLWGCEMVSGCRHGLLHHCGEASRRATWLDMVLTLEMAGVRSTVGTQLLAAGHGVRLRAFCALPNVVGGSENK